MVLRFSHFALALAALTGAPALAQAGATPDLSGYWTHATATTLERDPKFGDRLVMTPAEADAAEDEMVVGDEHRARGQDAAACL